ncbi:MAG: ABC transporter permease, partial [Elusimicrobiota bacterium]|nr:ABC transporter permease [Elusimicrobiota bacterium]
AYPVSLVPEKVKTIYMLNPIAVIIDSYRVVVLKGTAPNFIYLLISFAVSIAILIISYLYFKKVEKYFADVI